ncbi:MAG: type II secretion system protein [Chthoniobacterales bacterium]
MPAISRKFSLRAFTLIELLVVIGIVAVLLTLLGAGFSRAKRSADQAKNINNLKQIGIASLTYAAEHNGKTPPYSSGSSKSDDTTISYNLASGRTPARYLFEKGAREDNFGIGEADYLGSVDLLYSPFLVATQSRPKGELIGDGVRKWVSGYLFFYLPRNDEKRSTLGGNPPHPTIFNDRLTESPRAPLYSDRLVSTTPRSQEFTSDLFNVLFLDGSVKTFDYDEVLTKRTWKDKMDFFAGKSTD